MQEVRQRHIRPGRVEDAAAIAAIVEQAYTPWIAVIGRRPRPMDEDYTKRCTSGHAWVLEVDGIPIGTIIAEEIEGAWFLHNVAVLPQQHHRGFGRLLLQFFEDEALRRGFHEAKLTTTVAMQRNVDLYRALGYAVTGIEKTPTVDRLLMTKRLGRP